MVVALSVALAGVVAASAYAGVWALAVAVGLVQGLVIAGWHRSLAVPGAAGAALLAGGTALAADLLLAGRDDVRPLAPVTGALGLALVAAFGHQLLRRGDRARMTASLTATVTLCVVVVLAALLLAALRIDDDAGLVAGAVLAAAAGRALAEPPLPVEASVPLALAAGALVSGAVAARGDLGAGPGAAVGVAAAATAVVARFVLLRTPAAHLTLAAALPLALAGPAAYVLGRLLVG